MNCKSPENSLSALSPPKRLPLPPPPKVSQKHISRQKLDGGKDFSVSTKLPAGKLNLFLSLVLLWREEDVDGFLNKYEILWKLFAFEDVVCAHKTSMLPSGYVWGWGEGFFWESTCPNLFCQNRERDRCMPMHIHFTEQFCLTGQTRWLWSRGKGEDW